MEWLCRQLPADSRSVVSKIWLFEQGEYDAGLLIRLSEDCGAGLLQYLQAHHLRDFFGYIGVADALFGGYEVLANDAQIANGRT